MVSYLPTPKKPKKKVPSDEKQKSLFSFVEKTKEGNIEEDKTISNDEGEKIKKPKVSQEKPKITAGKEEKKKGPPEKLYFQSNGTPFGLKEGGIRLQKKGTSLDALY